MGEERTIKLLYKKAHRFCEYVNFALINHPDNIRQGIPFCVKDGVEIVPMRDVKAMVSIGSLWGDDGDEIMSLMMKSDTLEDRFGIDIMDSTFYTDYLEILNRAKFSAIRYK